MTSECNCEVLNSYVKNNGKRQSRMKFWDAANLRGTAGQEQDMVSAGSV